MKPGVGSLAIEALAGVLEAKCEGAVTWVVMPLVRTVACMTDPACEDWHLKQTGTEISNTRNA